MKFKTHKWADSMRIEIIGDKLNPEPGTAIISFPGGHVEVSRCTDGIEMVSMLKKAK